MKQLRILLINPFFIFSGDKYDLNRIKRGGQELDIPLGLASISGYIKKHFGGEVAIEVYDANAEAVAEIIKIDNVDMNHLFHLVESKVSSFAPDIVGVSALFEFSGNLALKFADLVKKINGKIITVMGGAYASFSYKRAFNNQNLDFIIYGEGEE